MRSGPIAAKAKNDWSALAPFLCREVSFDSYRIFAIE
jgi:hypothetical protein